MRVVIVPVRARGERMPTRRRLERELRRLSAHVSRATYGRLRIGGVVAPVVALGRREGREPDVVELRAAIRAAVAAGARFDGGIPVFVVPSRPARTSYASPSLGAVIRGPGWSRPATVAHELGHTLGLGHAVAPTACRRPFRPLGCTRRPRSLGDYGDAFDLMGSGADAYGAFSLAALGAAPVTDAPPGRAGVVVRPLGDRAPTLLRLRTARRDWFVESRRRAGLRDERPVAVPRGVAISRVLSLYAPERGDLYPQPVRVPASEPSRACTGGLSCLSRQLFRPGRSLTVPGAFRLRVLRGGPPGTTRVETTWLDRTPPAVKVTGAAVVRPFGAGAELALDIRTSAVGAGVASAQIDQAGTVTRIDPDAVPGLVGGRRGAGVVRAPLVAGARTASVRLVDAAGNVSAPAAVDLLAAPSRRAATVTFDPPLGSYKATAAQTLGRPVTVSGTTDPGLAGLTWRLGTAGRSSPDVELPIRPGGVVSGTWTPPPAPGVYRLVAEVPVEREAGGAGLRTQTFTGFVRG